MRRIAEWLGFNRSSASTQITSTPSATLAPTAAPPPASTAAPAVNAAALPAPAPAIAGAGAGSSADSAGGGDRKVWALVGRNKQLVDLPAPGNSTFIMTADGGMYSFSSSSPILRVGDTSYYIAEQLIKPRVTSSDDSDDDADDATAVAARSLGSGARTA